MDSSTSSQSITNNSSSEAAIFSTKSKSQGKQCAAYGCNSRHYDKNKESTGLHFFHFPQSNLEKSVWCNLIKRQDDRDNFKVTKATVLCDKHFSADDIKKNIFRWTLKPGAKPCFFYSIVFCCLFCLFVCFFKKDL